VAVQWSPLARLAGAQAVPALVHFLGHGLRPPPVSHSEALQSLHRDEARVAEICLLLAEVAESDAHTVGQVCFPAFSWLSTGPENH
jgi:hypothetical protein